MLLQSFPSILYRNPFPSEEMKIRFDRIKSNWLPLFIQAAQACNLPLELLVAKSSIESGGFQNVSNGSYVGLMQLGKTTISDCLDYLKGKMYADGKRWMAPIEISNRAVPLIRKYFPSFSNKKSIDKEQAYQLAKSPTKNGAAFNILIGALYLHFLCHNPKFIEGNTLRLDKVMSAYNTGPNYSFYKTPTTDTAQLVNIIQSSNSLTISKKSETSRHILKFCGIGGAFDLLFNKKYNLQ